MGRQRRVAAVSRSGSEACASQDEDAWSDPGGGREELKECHICLEPIVKVKDLCFDGGLASHAACKKSKRYLDDKARRRGAMKSMRCFQAKHPVDFAYRVKDSCDNRPPSWQPA